MRRFDFRIPKLCYVKNKKELGLETHIIVESPGLARDYNKRNILGFKGRIELQFHGGTKTKASKDLHRRDT